MKKGDRVWIKADWYGGGRIGTVLGDPVFVQQEWVPVLWDDEEDPDFHKMAGLEIYEPFTPEEYAVGRKATAKSREGA